jgi:hypothetical protein
MVSLIPVEKKTQAQLKPELLVLRRDFLMYPKISKPKYKVKSRPEPEKLMPDPPIIFSSMKPTETLRYLKCLFVVMAINIGIQYPALHGQFKRSKVQFARRGCLVSLFSKLTTTLYPDGIRSHEPLLQSPRWQAETIP